MKRLSIVFLAMVAASFSEAFNVAYGKMVTSTGTAVHGADLSTLTDGIYRPRGTPWQNGTIWWNGTGALLEIDLGAVYGIYAMNLQADDNDAYAVDYWDGTGWVVAWNVPNYDNMGAGMQTRPDVHNDDAVYTLDSVVTTDRLRVRAVSGDSSYSVSELRADAVPDPTSLAVLALGAWLARRRR